ncbi:Uncharacterised protein [Mycobacteroides abscessus subsp. abscessus]|nr:Uncharacterised protein [Mycobacteroides abscessus subsp. abscessus]
MPWAAISETIAPAIEVVTSGLTNVSLIACAPAAPDRPTIALPLWASSARTASLTSSRASDVASGRRQRSTTVLVHTGATSSRSGCSPATWAAAAAAATVASIIAAT